jgi:hypothetical protein
VRRLDAASSGLGAEMEFITAYLRDDWRRQAADWHTTVLESGALPDSAALHRDCNVGYLTKKKPSSQDGFSLS